MRYRASIAIALGALVLACVFWRYRGPVEEQPSRAEATGSPPVLPPSVAREPDAVAEQADVVEDPTPVDSGSVSDLRSASQTFRHSTLLFAIRRAGFYCADVVSANESADGVWVASCSDPIGHYIVGLRGVGQFDVHQVGFIDSLAPVISERYLPLEPGSLPPQPLQK